MKITNCKFLKIFKINAIVIFPFVLYQDKNPSESIIQHEAIHLRQIKDEGVLKFYLKYFYEYFQGRRKGLSHYEAYRNICYEKEAYDSSV